MRTLKSNCHHSRRVNKTPVKLDKSQGTISVWELVFQLLRKRYNREFDMSRVKTSRQFQLTTSSQFLMAHEATTVSIEPVRLVSTGVVQKSQLVDSSGSISMWDNNTNLFQFSVTYRCTNVMVSSFHDQKCRLQRHPISQE